MFPQRFPLDFSIAVCQYIDMLCINCLHDKTKVTNSRQHKNNPTVWRRRHCLNCQAVWTTYERADLDNTKVINHERQTTPFNIGKLTISIARSFQHNKHGADFYSYSLAQTVQEELIKQNFHLSTDDIAINAHQVLQRFDPVAAVQYAAQHDLITAKRRPGRPTISNVFLPESG